MLRWYPKLRRSLVYPFNTSRSNPRKFFLYNHDTEAIEQQFDTSDDCEGCFDLSHDGAIVAVKYWSRRSIDIVDVKTAEVRFSFGPSRVWEVQFNETSTKLLVKAKSGGLSICSLTSPFEQMPVPPATDIRDGCSIPQFNQFILPSRRKGQVVFIDFKSGAMTQRELPLKCKVKCLRHTPQQGTTALLDTSGTISAYDAELNQLIWKTNIKSVHGQGRVIGITFTGDGQQIAIGISHSGGCDTVVLDSASGDRLRTITGQLPGNFPFADHCTLCSSGEVLNLNTGTVSRDLCAIADY